MDSRVSLKQPAVCFAPLMAVGMLAAYFGGDTMCAAIAAGAAAVLFLGRRKRAVILCSLGLLSGLLIMENHLKNEVQPILECAGSTVCSTVSVDVVTRDDSDDFTVFIGKVRVNGRTANVRITAQGKYSEGEMFSAVIKLMENKKRGEIYDITNDVLLEGRIEGPALGFIVDISPNKTQLELLREKIVGSVEQNLSGYELELANALMFGNDENLSEELSKCLKVCGVSHFTAVSGAHFAVFSAALMILANNTSKRKAMTCFLFAPIAMLFFGYSASIIRASVMFVLYGAAAMFGRKADPLNTVCACVAVVLAASPMTIMDAGFGMSAFGTLGAGTVGVRLANILKELIPQKIRCLSPLLTAFSVSLGAMTMTAPLGLVLYGGISLSGVAVSMILMPLTALCMTLAALTGITGWELFAVPISGSMKIALGVVMFFGEKNGVWLSMGFGGALALSVVFAALMFASVAGDFRIAEASVIGMATIVFAVTGAVYLITAKRGAVTFSSENVLIQTGSCTIQLEHKIQVTGSQDLYFR